MIEDWFCSCVSQLSSQPVALDAPIVLASNSAWRCPFNIWLRIIRRFRRSPMSSLENDHGSRTTALRTDRRHLRCRDRSGVVARRRRPGRLLRRRPGGNHLLEESGRGQRPCLLRVRNRSRISQALFRDVPQARSDHRRPVFRRNRPAGLGHRPDALRRIPGDPLLQRMGQAAGSGRLRLRGAGQVCDHGGHVRRLPFRARWHRR